MSETIVRNSKTAGELRQPHRLGGEIQPTPDFGNESKLMVNES
jgi:hypothetical protein